MSEPDPWKPLNVFTLPVSKREFKRELVHPGMYSYILNVVDNANNSQYARTLVLFDNQSSITTDNSSPMIVTSAVEETRYKWQNNLTNPISVSWKSHFRNNYHERNKLLSPVTAYKHDQKKVLDDLEDKDGKRTLKDQSYYSKW